MFRVLDMQLNDNFGEPSERPNWNTVSLSMRGRGFRRYRDNFSGPVTILRVILKRKRPKLLI